MDRIDRQIVHCLQRDGRIPFRRIGEVLGVSEQTVARRYRALCETGALRVMVLPEVRGVGGQSWFVRILCRPGTADAIARSIAARPDVSRVGLASGGSEILCAIHTSADNGGTVLLERLPQVAHILRFDAAAVMHTYTGADTPWLAFDDPLTPAQVELLVEGPVPVRAPAEKPSSTSLSSDDDALLAQLAADGRSSIAALATATGWPTSRVATRLSDLFATGTVATEVDLTPEQFGFNTTAFLWLTVPPGELEATAQALARHAETGFAAAMTGNANLMLAVTCRDTDALYRYVTTKVGALAAVQHVEVVPVLRRVKQGGTLVINGRLKPPESSRPPR